MSTELERRLIVIACEMVLLTDIEKINEANRVVVLCGTREINLDGDLVRSFVVGTNESYKQYPYHNCLETALKMMPPPLRPVLEYLYENLSELIV